MITKIKKLLFFLIVLLPKLLICQTGSGFLPKLNTQQERLNEVNDSNPVSLPGRNRNGKRSSDRIVTDTSLPEIYKNEHKLVIKNDSFNLPGLNTVDKDLASPSRIRRKLGEAQDTDEVNQDIATSPTLTSREAEEAQKADPEEAQLKLESQSPNRIRERMREAQGFKPASTARSRIEEAKKAAQEIDSAPEIPDSSSWAKRKITKAQETDAANQDRPISNSLIRRRIEDAQESAKMKVDDDGLEVIDINENETRTESSKPKKDSWVNPLKEKTISQKRTNPEPMKEDFPIYKPGFPSDMISEPERQAPLPRKTPPNNSEVNPIVLRDYLETNNSGANIKDQEELVVQSYVKKEETNEISQKQKISIPIDTPSAPKRRVPGETNKVGDDEIKRQERDVKASVENLERNKQKQSKLIHFFENEINLKEENLKREKDKLREANAQKVILKDAKSIAIAISQGGERIAIPLDKNGKPYLLNDSGELFSMNVGRWQQQARDLLGLKYDRQKDYEDPLQNILSISKNQYNFNGTANTLKLSDGINSKKLEPNNMLPKAEEELSSHPNLQVLVKSIATSQDKLSAAKVNLEKLNQNQQQQQTNDS